jgi:AmmeMemoRadiSam system protein B
MIRQPAVAGQFYRAFPETLRAEVTRHMPAGVERRSVLAGICPHAGLMYSGPIAGEVYARIAIPSQVILIGPNHTGEGPPVSVFSEGAWEIPGGTFEIDDVLAAAIMARCRFATADESAHRWEHCLEVQLPFLQQARPDARIVPIVLGTTHLGNCRELGLTLASLVQETAPPNQRPLLLATTDMSHYEPDHATRKKDRFALDAIEHLDADGLVDAVRMHHITMCGLGPTLAVITAARALGASSASLVRYGTSGDTGGDLNRVVGYAGFTIP